MIRPDTILLLEPNIDSDLGLSFGVEPYTVKGFFLWGDVILGVGDTMRYVTPNGWQ